MSDIIKNETILKNKLKCLRNIETLNIEKLFSFL